MAIIKKIMGPPGTGKTYRLINHYLKKELNEYNTDPQKIVYITNHYVNNTDWWKRDREEYIEELIKFLEENVIHGAMDNNYK